MPIGGWPEGNVQARRSLDFGAILMGAIFLLVGGYFLLRNTLGFALPDLDWNAIWPLAIIAIGISIVYRAYTGTWRRGRA
jgi:NADH:ubiquinone oxidoreductase subunit 4 (subunit M)